MKRHLFSASFGSYSFRKKITPWCILALPMIFTVWLKYYPILSAFYISLFQYDPIQSPGTFVGLSNYVSMFKMPYYWEAWKNTFIFLLLQLAMCFFIPLIIALVQGNKGYCNRYCGRGQLFGLLGGRLGLSRKKDIPGWMKSRAFRYGFLVFFLIMFCQMLWNTVLVFTGASDLKQVVTLLWIFKLPWHWAYHGTLFHPGTAQFAFGFYSVMLTSTILGLITMVLFKPRSWCVYCPMGTMTQLICKGKNGKK